MEKYPINKKPHPNKPISDDPWEIWNFLPQDKSVAGFHYSWHEQKIKRHLNFVHIAKNAGSSIVQAAIQANLNWGDCLFRQHWPGRTCPQAPVQTWPDDDPAGWRRVWWHLPIQSLPLEELSENSTTGAIFTNPYQDFDLFAVIRNPYDRAVSEFYYHCGRYPNLCSGLHGRRAARVMNRNIQKACKLQLRTIKTSADYVYHECHWIPQYDFFVHEPKGHRKIDHLLHLETLEEEFDSLMKAYNLTHVRLPSQPVKPRNNDQMHVLNLTMSTIKLIEVVYEHDFVLGEYEMMSPKWGEFLEMQQLRQTPQ